MARPCHQAEYQHQRHHCPGARQWQAPAQTLRKGRGQRQQQQRAKKRRKILVEEQDNRQADPLPVGHMPEEGCAQPKRQPDRPRKEQASGTDRARGNDHQPSRGNSAWLTKIPSISTRRGKCPLLLAKKAEGRKPRSATQSIIAR